MITVNLTLDDQDFTPTRWENAKYRAGFKLVEFAERLRMSGERLAGETPRTDHEDHKATYEWGYRMGRKSALDAAAAIALGSEATR